jgi:hypothetical protein
LADAAGASVVTAGVSADVSAGAAWAIDAFRPSPYSLRKRISAGSSTVELADLTNSPISLNFSRTNLLSTPNSLASSCTRVLATFLLLAQTRFPGFVGGGSQTVGGCCGAAGLIGSYSSGAHELMLQS